MKAKSDKELDTRRIDLLTLMSLLTLRYCTIIYKSYMNDLR